MYSSSISLSFCNIFILKDDTEPNVILANPSSLASSASFNVTEYLLKYVPLPLITSPVKPPSSISYFLLVYVSFTSLNSILLPCLNAAANSGCSTALGPTNINLIPSTTGLSVPPLNVFAFTCETEVSFNATYSGTSLDISSILYRIFLLVIALSVLCCFFKIKKSPSCTLFLSAEGKLTQILPSSAL